MPGVGDRCFVFLTCRTVHRFITRTARQWRGRTARQYRLFELPGVRLQLAREVIRAKIHNQRVMLMRNGDVPIVWRT